MYRPEPHEENTIFVLEDQSGPSKARRVDVPEPVVGEVFVSVEDNVGLSSVTDHQTSLRILVHLLDWLNEDISEEPDISNLTVWKESVLNCRKGLGRSLSASLGW